MIVERQIGVSPSTAPIDQTGLRRQFRFRDQRLSGKYAPCTPRRVVSLVESPEGPRSCIG